MPDLFTILTGFISLVTNLPPLVGGALIAAAVGCFSAILTNAVTRSASIRAVNAQIEIAKETLSNQVELERFKMKLNADLELRKSEVLSLVEAVNTRWAHYNKLERLRLLKSEDLESAMREFHESSIDKEIAFIATGSQELSEAVGRFSAAEVICLDWILSRIYSDHPYAVPTPEEVEAWDSAFGELQEGIKDIHRAARRYIMGALEKPVDA
jgi:hypothetical protein